MGLLLNVLEQVGGGWRVWGTVNTTLHPSILAIAVSVGRVIHPILAIVDWVGHPFWTLLRFVWGM